MTASLDKPAAPAEASVNTRGRVNYHDDHEWTRYTFTVEGELAIGTLGDYARAVVGSQYAGGDVSREVKTWDATYTPVHQYRGAGDDYAHHSLALDGPNGPEVAHYSIDLRA